MSSLRISYSPRFDATPEAEIAALAAAYRFILDAHAQKKATEPAFESAGCDAATLVREMEEVSYVDRQPD